MDKFPLLCEDEGNFWKKFANFLLKKLGIPISSMVAFVILCEDEENSWKFHKILPGKFGIPISSMDEFPGNPNFKSVKIWISNGFFV